MTDVERIQAQPLDENEIACIWEGQLGFLFRAGKTVFGIDVYFWPFGERLFPPRLK